MNAFSSYSKDKQGRYLSANPEFIAFTHIQNIDALIGKNDRDMPWSCNADQIMANDAYVISSGQSQVFIEQATIHGKKHFRRCFKSPLIGSGGKILGIVGMSVPADPSILIPLSVQQNACLKELALGSSIKRIAKDLGLSPRTVEHYLNSVKDKLGCESRSDLIVHAVLRGLIVG